MNKSLTCVSLCCRDAAELERKIAKNAPLAGLIEIRFDCLAPEQRKAALRLAAARNETFIITFRPADQGGCGTFDLAERDAFWQEVCGMLPRAPFYIDLELGLPLRPDFDERRTIISFHDFEGVPENLVEIADELVARAGSGIVKIAVRCNDAAEAVAVWQILKKCDAAGRSIIAIAMGEGGKWTRILGPAHGAFLTYAAPDEASQTADGQISLADLRDLYRIDTLTRESEVYGLIAIDTSYSLSPAIHNTAFREAKRNAVFLPLQTRDLERFMREMALPRSRAVELNFRGFAVTNPHKQAVMRYLDKIDAEASAIGAVNTIKIDGEKLVGSNTDAEAFVKPLSERVGDVAGSRIAVAGAGGAARACVYALRQHGADVTVFARDTARAGLLADSFGARAAALPTAGDRAAFADFDVFVNATPLGTRGALAGDSVAGAEQLKSVSVVYDLTYNPENTPLRRAAVAAGAQFIGGLEMLIGQAARQFELWTNLPAPRGPMFAAARSRLRL